MALMYDMGSVNRAMQAATALCAQDITPRERQILNQFAAMKPVEADVVVHARWELRKGMRYCSRCGNYNGGRKRPRCHTCGAYMDAKEDKSCE